KRTHEKTGAQHQQHLFLLSTPQLQGTKKSICHSSPGRPNITQNKKPAFGENRLYIAWVICAGNQRTDAESAGLAAPSDAYSELRPAMTSRVMSRLSPANSRSLVWSNLKTMCKPFDCPYFFR